MRGREWFKLTAPLLTAVSIILRAFPRRLLLWVWPIWDLVPGLIGIGLRYAFAQRLARRIGRNVMFARGVEIRSWENLTIGENVSIHKDCYLDAAGGIDIGNDVSVAHGSSILSFEHGWSETCTPIRSNPIRLAPVVIGDDVWIGCGCRLLAGVTIGRRVIIAAGAVVAKDVGSATIVAGVPARFLRTI